MSVAAAAAAAAAVAAVLALAAPATARGTWVTPTSGEVTRVFDVGPDPFAGGQHRGADFAAKPGAEVRAVCGGAVVVAGRVGSSGRVVTLRCGPWRVTHMPLAEVAVRPGEAVRRGTRIGSAAAGARHAGLHLGVRREGRRFGYVDPLRFLRAPPATSPPLVRAPRVRPPAPRVRPPAPPWLRPAATEPRAAPTPIRRAAFPGSSPAPWFVWGGLAVVLAGAAGAARWRLAPSLGRRPGPRAAAQEVP